MREVMGGRIRQTDSAVGVLRLLLILSLTGPMVVLAFVTFQGRTLLLDNATNRTTRMAELLAQQVSSAFDGYNVALSRIEEHLVHSEGAFQEQPLHEYLAEIDRDMSTVDGLVIVGEDGKALAHSRYFPVPKTYIGDRDYIRSVTAAPEVDAAGRDSHVLLQGRDGLTLGLPVRSRFSQKVVLPASRARRDLTGQIAGTFIVSISQRYFEDFFRALALTPSDRVALVRADSRVLVQIPASPGRPSIDPQETGTLDAVALAANDANLARRLDEGTIDYVSPLDDARRISGFRKVDGYPIYVEVGFAVDGVLTPWRRQAAINLVIAVLATLVLFTVTRLALRKTRDEAAMHGLMLAEARQRIEAESALRQAQKMEALGQLTGGIAHDFNNLLNIVLVNLELAAKRLGDRQGPDLDRLDGYVKSATQGAERGVALTRRLLAFAHRQEVAPGPVKIPDLVTGLVDLLGQAAGARVRITLDTPRGLPAVLADPNELETALLNLVVNARDAMPEGGRIHIAVREDGTSPRHLVLSVKDTGCGMDAAMLTRVTEPFFTTKELGKGSGLGLAMVERFATQSGGRLTLESRPGQGTTVEIFLPVA
ncbi:hybrid sensor histidine kinase/response regulator [Methylobacterium haplocladii]|uniref:histidine kinase n=1 Tax=Methylobacterium haplocladii TaxID=1176176 RepID=A0A512IL81_9HYPH|nr:hybrid sensor histidine kinase/response regulator [Methylobacterium haplocladii]GEO98473.1 hybrid sensor histidine kinase/response regulator [Methylobacterium haplocladii]GJD86449.1 Adaptive-response sensory-kinase SasA [Methylobacterium haplocladii]GLS60638.1 hybrid sensor histidine kinase/response regulator [Methylobacterium haplocladii]